MCVNICSMNSFKDKVENVNWITSAMIPVDAVKYEEISAPLMYLSCPAKLHKSQ